MAYQNGPKKIIPCLDIFGGRVVKGVNFVDLIDAGDPALIAKSYCESGADELVFLDISATNEERDLTIDTLKKVVKEIDIPLAVGGGIRTHDDIKRILGVGASKISINSQAVKTPDLITSAANEFGSSKIVVAVDVKQFDNSWHVMTHGGKVDTKLDAILWSKQMQDRGAGEILLTSMDRDGAKTGFDLAITGAICDAVDIPVTASGGAGTMEHFLEAFKVGAASGLGASVFHFGIIKIPELKAYLANNGIEVTI